MPRERPRFAFGEATDKYGPIMGEHANRKMSNDMVITARSFSAGESANVLIAVLIVLLACSAIVAAYLSLSANDARLTRIVADEEGAFSAAESGLDYGFVKLKSVLMDRRTWPGTDSNCLQKVLEAIPPPPSVSTYAHSAPSGSVAFRLRVESEAMNGPITNGPGGACVEGVSQYFSITCGALNPRTGIGCVLKRWVRAVELPLIRFAIFGSDDTAIVPANALEMHGPVHVNGDLLVGGPAVFHDPVSASGRILLSREMSGEGRGVPRFGNAAGELVPMVEDGTVYDSDNESWTGDALRRWNGRVLSGEHGVQKWLPPATWAGGREVIERLRATNSPSCSAQKEAEKFAGRAVLRFCILTNGTVRAQDAAGKDVSARFSNVVLKIAGETNGWPIFAKEEETGAYRFESAVPGMSVYDIGSKGFFDVREGTMALPVDVYIDELQAAMTNLYGPAAAGPGSNIVYFTRDDPDGISNGVLPCVRIRNAARVFLPGGLTVASDLPVYIEGDVNLGMTEPFLVAGDSATFLSKAWQDAFAADGHATPARAQSTTYNLAVMAGGGGMASPLNGLRILEDWSSGAELTFNGSFIDMWRPALTTGRWDTVGLAAPAITWRFDRNYTVKAPPGVARVRGVEELRWERTTWAREGW